MTKYIVVLLTLMSAGTCVAGDLLLLEFPSANLDSTRMTLQELESTGAFARHIFAPNMAIVDAPNVSLCKSRCAIEGVSAFETDDVQLDRWSGAASNVRAAFQNLAVARTRPPLPIDTSLHFENCLPGLELQGDSLGDSTAARLSSSISRILIVRHMAAWLGGGMKIT